MKLILLVFALAVAGDTGPVAPLPPLNYAEAYKESMDTGKPMLVMVSTEWCPPCKVMKYQIMPKVREDGALDGFAFTKVNPDTDNDLAKQIIGDGPIPELVLYRKTTNGWVRTALIGSQSVETVEEFLKPKTETKTEAKP